MDELAAAAAVVAMDTDDFAEMDLEQYAMHDVAAIDEVQRPAAEAAEAQDENKGGNTVPGGPEIANPKVANAPRIPRRTRCGPPITRPDCHACVPRRQVSEDLLLQTADFMFPIGKGAPRAMPKDGGAAPLIHALLFNTKTVVDKLWKQRGWDPKKPEKTKAALGYALDQEEAAAYVVASALHKPLLSPLEARYIGRRINNLAGPCGSITSKLKALRKRGKSAAPQVTAMLQAAAALSFAPPPKQSSARSRASAPAPPPAPPPVPPPVPPMMQQPSTRAACAAATPLQQRFGVPSPSAWGPDEEDLPDDPQPSSPGAPAAALAELSEPWLHSPEAARAIIAGLALEAAWTSLDGGCKVIDVEEEVEVRTVRYKRALLRLQAAIPSAVPELVLEPQMANDHNSIPCPYGFGRIVRRPWELHLGVLGFCGFECVCGALRHARDEVVVTSGVGWPDACQPDFRMCGRVWAA